MTQVTPPVIDAANRFVNSRAGLAISILVLLGVFVYPDFKDLKDSVRTIATQYETIKELAVDIKAFCRRNIE